MDKEKKRMAGWLLTSKSVDTSVYLGELQKGDLFLVSRC